MRNVTAGMLLLAVWMQGPTSPARAQGNRTQTTANAATASDAPTGAAGAPLLAVDKFTLANGLEVIHHEDRRLPVVCVDIWYHVGALHEQPGKSGFAHLFEHLMFQGSAHVPGDSHLQLLEAAGASALNGTTGFDSTNYFQCVPKNEVELALWLESDRMGWLATSVTKAKLDEQRNVVKNERRAGLENKPWGLAEEKAWQSLFPADHPYAGAVIGSMADLDRATLEDVIRFHDAYYAPSNATLALTGDISRAEAANLVDKYFKTLPVWPKPASVSTPTPSVAGEVRVDVEDALAPLAKVVVQYLTPAAFKPGSADVEVLARILGEGNASRLHQALVVDKKLAHSVEVQHLEQQNVSVLALSVVVKVGQSPEAVVAALLNEVEVLQDLPPGDDEVARVVNAYEAERILALQLPIARAQLLQHYNHHLGAPDRLEEDLARVRAVTPDSIRSVVEAHLGKDQRVILIARPKGTAPPASSADGTKEGA